MSATRRVLPWVLALVLGLSFLGSGLPKINPSEAMTARFEAWGYSATFAVIVGVAESLGGLMVLIPGLALYGATIIAVDMTGAVYTHVATGIGSPVSALAYLAIGAALGWRRRRDAWAPGRHR